MNWVNALYAALACGVILTSMTTLGRDQAIVQLVARFKQMGAEQIREIVFGDNASHTPCNRALRRLVQRRELIRIEHRLVGGSNGGSGQYVYSLGPISHPQFFPGRYIPLRSINYHTIAIGDSFLSFLRLERAGRIRIIGYIPEPDCHVSIRGHELKPDLHMELENPDLPSGRMRIWLEVDLGSEGRRQIEAKIRRYYAAFNAAEEDEFPEWTVVAFVAVDEQRAEELTWWLSSMPSEVQELFKVWTLDQLYTALS